MTVIGFVRHGVTAWNKERRAQGSSDIPLDLDGVEMAHRIAERLSGETWDIIFTSPLVRARKTAELIALRKENIDLVVDSRLGETGGGQIEGTTEAERILKWGASWNSLDLGRESNEQVLSRGLNFIDEIGQTYSDEKVLVVSHGSFIRKLIKALVPEDDLDEALANTSITIIQLNEGGNHCIVHNCTKHL
ncbi:histidine phosphatase family protein [Sporosarcina siberiensis]|uniref:Histidine phosphatase family protein n=1 Tax=Sporosarcina siberiensis TaxID=1365606 RepID=A0ABW4SHP3_9BACL